MNIERKAVWAELKKVDDKGEGVLRIIKFHQEDKDNDVTYPGFIGRQEAVLIPSHNWRSDEPPLGRGVTFEEDGSTHFSFRMNLDHPLAQRWLSWLKFDAGYPTKLQQISYGFSPYADATQRGKFNGKDVRFLKPRPDGTPGAKLHEVSFVMVGSGNDQGVLDIKGQDWSRSLTWDAPAAPPIEAKTDSSPPLITTPPQSHVISPHHTATDDRVWNAWLNQLRVKATADRKNYYHALYAVSDASDGMARHHFRGLHHHVDDAGEPGAANVRACLDLIAALHKGHFPASEREGLYRHLSAHLKDAGIEAVPLADPESYGIPMDLRVQVSTWAVDSVVEDLIGIHDMRSRKGMTLTEARLQQVRELSQRIEAFCQILQLKSLDKPYSAQVQEFADRQFVEQLHDRLDKLAEADRQRTQHAERALAEEHYQRFLAMERRFHGDVHAS